MNGIQLIAAERERQLTFEGYQPEHDDKHTRGELAAAAHGYALLAAIQSNGHIVGGANQMTPPPAWPFDQSSWKPSDDKIRNLEKAGALIAAELDRLLRLHERDARRKRREETQEGGIPGPRSHHHRQGPAAPRKLHLWSRGKHGLAAGGNGKRPSPEHPATRAGKLLP